MGIACFHAGCNFQAAPICSCALMGMHRGGTCMDSSTLAKFHTPVILLYCCLIAALPHLTRQMAGAHDDDDDEGLEGDSDEEEAEESGSDASVSKYQLAGLSSATCLHRRLVIVLQTPLASMEMLTSTANTT